MEYFNLMSSKNHFISDFDNLQNELSCFVFVHYSISDYTQITFCHSFFIPINNINNIINMFKV